MSGARRRAVTFAGVLAVAAAWGLLALAPGARGAEDDPMAEILRRRIESPGGLSVSGEELLAKRALPLLYEWRLYAPAWLEAGRPAAGAAVLREAVRASRLEGLDPNDYYADRLDELAAAAAAPEAATGVLIDFDLLHTDAFLILAAHLVNGRIHPETFDAEWIAVRREVDLVALLHDALADGAVAEALASLRPEDPRYGRLVEALARYRQLAADGGWAPIAEGPTLEPGATDARVPAIARRLQATGELAVARDGEVYGDELAVAVRRFQVRHGLEPDAKIGPRTIEALSVPAAQRGRQIELSLARWRWLPQNLGERHVLVNIPDFSLVAVEQGSIALEMRVVVGRPYRRTPVFSDQIRYLVFNPFWEVPPSIAVQDKLPLIKKDPTYFGQQGIRVYTGWGADERAVDPAAVDWSQVARGAFPYRLRQDPGPLNALGRVKFMFPNKFNVYLHDTPSRELFRSEARDLSSGCIRLERPLDLAVWVLADDPAWNRAAVDRLVAAGATRTVSLPELVQVHLQYWTSWVAEDGTVQFRRDIYGRDAILDEALRTRRDAIEG